MINDHAAKVLDAYLDAEQLSVPHAVLIEGRWGSGKTYFLQNVYEPARKERMRTERRHHTPFLFVSLFGANSASDVEMRIYKAACPGEAVAGAIAGTIALGIGEFFRVKDAAKGTVDKLGKKAIRRLSDYVFVFDDLERIEKQAFGEVMGLINSFIAEHGRRVILVTDEKKLSASLDNGLWKEQNEKIIGRRAHIEADFESVIQNAINNLPDGLTKQLMSNQISDFLRVASAAKVENLRNLSWAMHNTIAFVNCLTTDQDIPEKHILSTMLVVLATTLWMRSGLLDADVLEKIPGLSRTLALRSFKRNKEDTPLDPVLETAKKFSDTFHFLSIDAPPVDYGLINGFENSGVLNPDKVKSWIKFELGIGEEHAEPSWRKLWYSFERPIAETEGAIATLQAELHERKYTEYGPILHSVGLAIQRQNLNDKRLTDGEDVVLFFKKYIDDIAEKGVLKNRTGEFLVFVESHAGMGFTSRETPEFEEICKYLDQKSQELQILELRDAVDAIVQEAENNHPQALMKLVDTDKVFSVQPLLQSISSDRIATLMAQDAPALNVGAKMLAYRYHRARNGDELLQEIRWAREVYASVIKKLEGWDEPYRTMGVEHLNGLIRHYERGKQPDDMIIPPEAD
ncbi:P-loop NTPase fold protein [Agrobacterium sp. Azo12]|uniref:P-loop NTPase fold protein n=1 Tax=Agrobacterium sp. Azo12 TaxID=3031129 RepID=UPI0023D8A849|nr:P-loop NTPase fold protein [Agrobacterium sp. Azo12]MDO5895664.1 P-loop NTPase fold protein [Agrobacterium sp. Azo12]